MLGNRARAFVIGVVCTVWAANFLAGIFVKDYKPNESINAIFMGIVGTLFTLTPRRHSSNSQDHESEELDSPPPKKSLEPKKKPPKAVEAEADKPPEEPGGG